MVAASHVVLAFTSEDQVPSGELHLAVLPKARGNSPPLLEDCTHDMEREEGLEPIQLLESSEYIYLLDLGPTQEGAYLEPLELFEPDDDSNRRGRLKTGLATGRVPIRLMTASGVIIGQTAVEVRSRKFDYLKHYRWMLGDIAEQMAELVMERFAASEQYFSPDNERGATSLYQRFEFLQASLASQEFEASIQQIFAKPYVHWITKGERRPPGYGIRPSSQVARQIAGVGPRVHWPGGARASVPATFSIESQEASLDNVPNRFIKFALQRWRDLTWQVHDLLDGQSGLAPVGRGLREVTALGERLDALLQQPMFRGVNPLTQLPGANQVLQKREGYRDLLGTYVQSEVAAKLAWPGGEALFSAGQRNVAALYEYWTFLQLAAVIKRITHQNADLSDLIEIAPDGMSISLARGRAARVSGSVLRFGRRIGLELWFNRTFSGQGRFPDSWSRAMRPDVTLKVSVDDAIVEPSWLHFDAKYRLDHLSELTGGAPETAKEEQEYLAIVGSEGGSSAKRSDLLKMHAYRDAIRRSSGAYVLFPGDSTDLLQPYDEILPGLGAFVLRPTDAGMTEGFLDLQHFLDRVLDHFASQPSQHERERYWTRESHLGRPLESRVVAAEFLTKPPADTRVLLAYVRSAGQLTWIHSQGLYNLRAGARQGAVELGSDELASQFLVLYGPHVQDPELWRVVGNPRVATRQDLLDTGYGSPGGDVYFCLSIEPVDSMYRLSSEQVARAASAFGGLPGGPIGITWAELIAGSPLK